VAQAVGPKLLEQPSSWS